MAGTNLSSAKLVYVVTAIVLIAISATSSLVRGKDVPGSNHQALQLVNPSIPTVAFEGTILPFLANATQVSDANPQQQVVLGFYLSYKLSDSEYNSDVEEIDSWETTVGLSPGVEFCPWEESLKPNETVATAISLPCELDGTKTLATIGQAEAALNITIYTYTFQGQTFYANSNDPYLPVQFAGMVVDIEGLNDFNSLS